MADTKISALTSSTTPLAGTEVLPIVQGASTVKVSVANLTAGRAISATTLTASTGDITSTAGNFVVGTSGKGIDFTATSNSSGTMTSELLADYEEGTWTPTLIASGGGASTTQFTGRYTKIGNVVYFNAYMNDDASNNFGSGSLTFGGLPYTCGSVAAQRGVVGILTRRITKPSTSTQLVGWVNPSDTTIGVWWNGTDGNSITALNAADVNVASQVIFAISGFYQV
jgi:hypothetical protein